LLEALFPAVWADRVVELGRLRRRLRAHGLAAEVARATESLIVNRNWLPAIDDSETRRHAHR
jgi:precorrin-2 dehydrogenase/sirohydrochlorin ferrochelatase